MNFLWFALIGLVAGVLAKAIMPGDAKEPKGCLMTMLLGMGGAILFGFLAGLVPFLRFGGSIIGQLGSATVGAILIIWLLRRFTK